MAGRKPEAVFLCLLLSWPELRVHSRGSDLEGMVETRACKHVTGIHRLLDCEEHTRFHTPEAYLCSGFQILL